MFGTEQLVFGWGSYDFINQAVFFGFVGVTFFSLGAWWFPGLVVAVIVTVLDWTRRQRVVQESEEN